MKGHVLRDRRLSCSPEWIAANIAKLPELLRNF
jgi:hypothetical protein